MNIILYTTHCPKCLVLEKKLKAKNISYEEVTNVDMMLLKGFESTPMMEVDGNVMNFNEANKWINEQ